jgi:EmrB/QacA subfamily drug resistance transporter
MKATAQKLDIPSFSLRSILAPLIAIVLGTFMAVLDNTVVNVALPTLEKAFSSDLHTIEWVITGYLLAQAAIVPLTGWLCDRFGAKNLYLIALILFTLGSALCATAQSAGMLIAFRVLQGLGGGMLLPIGMSFVFRLAPPSKRGVVMGALCIPVMLGPALGPILGGWLVQYADWRCIFLINVPVGLLAVPLALRALPALAAERAPGALDALGAVLGPLGFSALIFGISQSSSDGWSGQTTLAGLAVGAAALVLFALRELTTAQPLLELRVFRSPDFSLAIVVQWMAQMAMMGGLFLVPLFLQQLRGYGAFDTGLALLPQALGAALFMPIGGKLFDKLGIRPLALAGMALMLGSTLILSQVSASTTAVELIVPLALRGMGMGLIVMPLNAHLLSVAPRGLTSRVTALTNALINVMGSLAIASLGTLLQNRGTTHINEARASIESYKQTVLTHAGGQATPPHGALVAIQQYTATALHHAMALAFDDTFLASSAVLWVGLLISFTLRRAPQGRDVGAEDEIAALVA